MTEGMDVVGVLLAARDSITPETWTQRVMFRGPGGRRVSHRSARHDAHQWCAVGAVCLAAMREAGLCRPVLDMLCHAAVGEPAAAPGAAEFAVGRWNDAPGRTWEDVWDLLDRAATLAKDSGR